MARKRDDRPIDDNTGWKTCDSCGGCGVVIDRHTHWGENCKPCGGTGQVRR